MNTWCYGDIVAYGYSADGYYNSHVYCWVSNNAYDWYQTSNYPVTVNDYDGLHWLDLTLDLHLSFEFIAFVAYDNNGYSVSVCLDSVHVLPQ